MDLPRRLLKQGEEWRARAASDGCSKANSAATCCLVVPECAGRSTRPPTLFRRDMGSVAWPAGAFTAPPSSRSPRCLPWSSRTCCPCRLTLPPVSGGAAAGPSRRLCGKCQGLLRRPARIRWPPALGTLDAREVRLFNDRWEPVQLHRRLEPGQFSKVLALAAARHPAS